MQRYSALHAVEPNWARRSVCDEPQRGQAGLSTTRGTKRMGRSCGACSFEPQLPIGGAMPYCLSLSRAASVIQSVVHAGASTVSMRWFEKPASFNAAPMSSAIWYIAGQPEYVGVMTISNVSS